MNDWKFYTHNGGSLIITNNDRGSSVNKVSGSINPPSKGNAIQHCVTAHYKEVSLEKALNSLEIDARETFLKNLKNFGYKFESGADDYWWFVGKKGFSYPIVCVDKKTNCGINFNKDGSNSRGLFNDNWSLGKTKPYFNEISFKEAMEYLTPEGAQKICESLNILDKKKTRISKKKIQELAQLLFENKALNGDTAFSTNHKDWNIFKKMQEKGIVEESPLDEKMFYLSKDWENRLKEYKKINKVEEVKEKKLRPWKMEEVPIGAYIKYKGPIEGKGCIIIKAEDGIIYDDSAVFNYSHYSPLKAFNEFEHSIDNGKTYHPCGVWD